MRIVTRALMCFAAGLTLVPPSACAEGWTAGGHLKYRYSYTDYRSTDIAAVVGADPAHDHGFDARLKLEWRGRGFDFALHDEILALAGDTVATRRALANAGFLSAASVRGLPDDSGRVMDLSRDIIDDSRRVAVHRVDRLALGYGAGAFTARVGRQAVSWGNGLAFQVLDFVNPFAPLAIDKDYKTGEDMLYGQWLAGEQGDVQLMLLPRRDPITHDIDHDRASRAVKVRGRAAGFDLDLLAASHFDQALVGAGLVRSIGGAVWRLDVLRTAVPDRDAVWSMLTNLDWSWVLWSHNMYGFVEYFRSGFGVAGTDDYRSLDPELAARIARGELFTLARDSAVAGLQFEATPLLNLFATLIQNLDDGGRLVQVRGTWDLRQNLLLHGGMTWPVGERGTEYGGIPTASPGTYVGAGRLLFLQGALYF